MSINKPRENESEIKGIISVKINGKIYYKNYFDIFEYVITEWQPDYDSINDLTIEQLWESMQEHHKEDQEKEHEGLWRGGLCPFCLGTDNKMYEYDFERPNQKNNRRDITTYSCCKECVEEWRTGSDKRTRSEIAKLANDSAVIIEEMEEEENVN